MCKTLLSLTALFSLLVSCRSEVPEQKDTEPKGAAKASVPEPRNIPYKIVATTPHDPAAFTQGLLLHEGLYYESTGGYGSSTLRQVEPKSGKVLKRHNLPASIFGEGLALRGGRLYQLSWQSGQGFIYDRESFKHLGNFRYQGEGWGLTWDGEHFILSDGSAFLRFLDPETFALMRSVKVRNHIAPVDDLNELEFVEGKVFANRWHTDEVLVINPASGLIEATLDLSDLERPRPRNQEAVLNGIAYDPKTRLLHVTGKLWPQIYTLQMAE